MYVFHRHLAALATLALAVLIAAPARAWVETSLRSDVVTIDLSADGHATIQHELVMGIRGGPLKGFDLEGVDSDAVPLENATVAPLTGARPEDSRPLLLERREDGVLRIDVDHERGLRRGTYLFRFGYRTDLAGRGLLEAEGAHVSIRWVGPRFSDGLDSARVVFRIPTSSEPPRLPDPGSRSPSAMQEGGGIFLATLRRAADTDELEVVRPHVAKGEPVVWRILGSHHAFPKFGGEPGHVKDSPSRVEAAPKDRVLFGSVLSAVLVLFSVLVFLKDRVVARAAACRGARSRALVPVPAYLRAMLAGAALSGAVAIAWKTTWPTLAAALLVLSMLLATLVGTQESPAPRAPGKWLPLTESDAFEPQPNRGPGRWLDTGAVSGFLVFVLLLALLCAIAVWLFPRSPYHALCVVLGCAALLPIFCTGRAASLPPDRAVAPVRMLRWIAAKVRESGGLKVVPWARIPEGQVEPDELRLLIMPRRAKSGLTAIEVGLDYHTTGAGVLGLPWVIVRATEGTPAHHALAQSVTWSRGRKPEERVAILRPALPTRTSCLALLLELTACLTERSRPSAPRQPSIRLTRSSGSGASTVNAATVASPAHAM